MLRLSSVSRDGQQHKKINTKDPFRSIWSLHN